MTDSGGYFNGNLLREYGAKQVYPPLAERGPGRVRSRRYLATATAAVTITMIASVGTGTLLVNANWAWITVEDIGT